ncbi:MAG: hypothetical protein LBG72_06740, partial [Spirochaetaceae bacterium]|nr:hypothetical protein [Spirochaetaceae bacterium]
MTIKQMIWKVAVVAAFVLAPCVYGAPNFSGVLDSKFTGIILDAPSLDEAFNFGIEEYLNLRMQAKVGDWAQIFGAFNFTAFAGKDADIAAQSGAGAFFAGENFASAIELERLYLHLSNDTMGLDTGLLRQGFGYGSVWVPTDFLNPRNPLNTDARPRAILSAVFSYFPSDTAKLLAFAAAPKKPMDNERGEGGRFGLSAEKHWKNISVQGLYVYETPYKDVPQTLVSGESGVHRAGLSVKADIEAGIYADILYTAYPKKIDGWEDGFAATLGADYSFAPREPNAYFQALIIAAEYLYSGKTSQTALGTGGIYSKHHYNSASVIYKATNYTSVTLTGIWCWEDGSLIPVAVFEQTLFQGLTLT